MGIFIFSTARVSEMLELLARSLLHGTLITLLQRILCSPCTALSSLYPRPGPSPVKHVTAVGEEGGRRSECQGTNLEQLDLLSQQQVMMVGIRFTLVTPSCSYASMLYAITLCVVVISTAVFEQARPTHRLKTS